MKNIVEPDEVFSPKDIKRLERWISYYENPVKPALVATAGVFFGVIALIVAAVQMGIKLPHVAGGAGGELLAFSCIVGAAVFFLIKPNAEQVFEKFDADYFRLSGITEDDYIDGLKNEVRQEACLRFTDIPNGRGATMFDYPEEQQATAYKEFEADFFRKCAHEERRLKFKAYVARRYGLMVPFK